MSDKELEIKKLKTKRFNLREKIRKYMKNGKNAKHLVIEFHEVIEKLREYGFNATIEKDYLQTEYWDNFALEKPIKSQKDNKIKPTPVPKPIQNTDIKIDNKSFSLCLAWTSLDNFPTPIQINKVKGYFDELCLKVEDESSKIVSPGCTEHILRYEFEGSEESFRLLKICTQFVLDSFAESDFDKFNIAVYGKRKNY